MLVFQADKRTTTVSTCTVTLTCLIFGFKYVFVKTSHTWSLSRHPYPWLDSQELVKRLHDTFGPRRLMWGTDWPIIEGVAKYDPGAHCCARRHEVSQGRRQEMDTQQDNR